MGQGRLVFVVTVFVAGFLLLTCVSAEKIFSLQPPYPAKVPFWTLSGSATSNTSYIQLSKVPGGATNTQGLMSSMQPLVAKNWEYTFNFTVEPQKFIAGEGLAFWVTTDPQRVGDMWGASESWTGFGIVFDTKTRGRQRRRPRIGLVVNDGTKTDYTGGNATEVMSSLIPQFRGTNSVCSCRVVSFNGKLSVSLAGTRRSWTNIIKDMPMDIPSPAYFSFSAETSKTSGDVHKIISSQLVELPDDPSQQQILDDAANYFGESTESAEKNGQKHHVKITVEDSATIGGTAIVSKAEPPVTLSPNALKETSQRLQKLEQSLADSMTSIKRNIERMGARTDEAQLSISSAVEQVNKANKDAMEMKLSITNLDASVRELQTVCAAAETECSKRPSMLFVFLVSMLGSVAGYTIAYAIIKKQNKGVRLL